MLFHTNFQYTDRESKAKYVWQKYSSILVGKILDVGADECYLRNYLPKDRASYWGIGLGGHPDQQVNLEQEKIPFPDNSYDCVLCLDVLEHIENIHDVFDELCRVSCNYVIVSLPNAWADFYAMLRFGDYKPGQSTKFYGLPQEIPVDRHKWFFSISEARSFIQYRAEKNKMKIVQMDNGTGRGEASNRFKRYLRQWARDFLFRKDLGMNDLYAGTLWTVLRK